MKKLLAVALLIIVNASLKAQIPNYNFECWDTFPGPPPYEEPCFYATLNPYSQFGYPIFVERTTDSHTDSFAVKVSTIGYTNPAPPFNYVVEVGLARISNDYQNGHSGFPYTQRPAIFSAWVKYQPLGGADSAEIKIKLVKWNVNLQQPQDVANAKIFVSSNDSAYHCMTANFIYQSPFITSGNPDSAGVYIQSSQLNDSTPGSAIKVDNITFGTCFVPVNEIVRNPQPNFYPNPAADFISFSSLSSGADRIKLFEITGRMVAAEAVSASHARIDLKMLNPGIYFYGVYDEDNKVVSSGKFSIVR